MHGWSKSECKQTTKATHTKSHNSAKKKGCANTRIKKMNITYEALTQTQDTITVIIWKGEIIECDHNVSISDTRHVSNEVSVLQRI